MQTSDASFQDLTPEQYRALAEFRYQIRRFLRFSEDAARTNGIEPQQHQLLLAIKGLPPGERATVRILAERLQLQHHSMVELINRLADHGAVVRRQGEEDRREVLVGITRSGEQLLRRLSLVHQAELESAAPALAKALGAAIRPKRRKRAA